MNDNQDSMLKTAGVAEEKHTAATPIHQASSVDPNYSEPSPPSAYRAVLDMHDAERDSVPSAAKGCIEGLMVLADKLIQRVEVLEAVLKPLAYHAPQVANARMCLTGAGRADEPAAGIWVSGVQNIHMTPNESIYYNAADVFGRGRVEKYLEDTFARVRKAQEAALDKSVHIEDGGKLH